MVVLAAFGAFLLMSGKNWLIGEAFSAQVFVPVGYTVIERGALRVGSGFGALLLMVDSASWSWRGPPQCTS